MKDIYAVALCPHCGIKSSQKLIYTHKFLDNLSSSDDEPFEWTALYFFAMCVSCKEILVYYSLEFDKVDKMFVAMEGIELVYPKSEELPQSVPKAISDIYREAVKLRKSHPDAFATQIRRALEALCKDRGVGGKTLEQRLLKLKAKGEIPQLLADVTDILRLLGNIGTHETAKAIELSQVNKLDKLFRLVVDYVYVVPHELQALRNSRRH
jgi:hypothetical protein